MFTKAADFSIKSDSSSPYGWMIEDIDTESVMVAGSVEKFVRDVVKVAIETQNYSHAKDSTVYKVWRSGWEFDQAVREIKEILADR